MTPETDLAVARDPAYSPRPAESLPREGLLRRITPALLALALFSATTAVVLAV